MNTADNKELVITEHTAIELERWARGYTGKIVDAASPLNGLEVFGHRWYVVAELDARAAKAAAEPCPLCSQPLHGEQHFHMACAERENAD